MLVGGAFAPLPSIPRDQQAEQQAPPQQTGASQTPSQQPTSPQLPPQQGEPGQLPPPAAPVRLGPVVVLDPGHGGTDTGARGASGLLEKDVTLQLARILRSELERLGYRTAMTRNDDANPSYEDRAAVANAYRDPIFVSLHVSSTGAIGNARVYFYQFPASFLQPDSLQAASAPSKGFGSAIPWTELQRPLADQSRLLANLVQIELARRFTSSPNAPAPAAVRNLRSVAAPAVAVEVSSVSVSDPIDLTSLNGPLAASIAKGIAAFRPINPPNASQP